jgi:sulfur-oxidizing protein SoxY
MRFARWIAGVAAGLVLAVPAWAAPPAKDPLASPRWGDMEKIFLAGERYEFDDRVKVLAPAQSENPMQVPVTVDATALPDVREVMVFADFNPFLEILRFYPESASPYLGFRVKLQQSSPVRAAARTGDGVWHLGGVIVNTVGGGCTAPSAGSASPEWQKRLNEVSARSWNEGPMSGRLRLRVIHPMDTGLVAGIPAFHLESLMLKDDAGTPLMRLTLSQPVSENPVFTLHRGRSAGSVEVSGRDNNGNTFDVRVAP